ncbi:putative membrane protein (plasmid) [Ligilactobacillus salivarius]|uniref:Putative membrane protein n=2 Tax=Ligilactobacillus salivarius TaxID=1624 RepID=A0A089RY84_9LACO|nr:putative membrane protein [Ligilactobacillus salivarius]
MGYVMLTSFGILFGFLFGFFLKRSHYCIAGGLRDITLEKNISGLISVLLIIFIQAGIFFSLIKLGIMPAADYPNYSLIAMIIGGFVFGIGAVASSGCISTALVKVGDGRITGLITMLSFIITVSSVNNGLLSNITAPLQNMTVHQDTMAQTLQPFAIYIILAILVITFIAMSSTLKKNKPSFNVPYNYTGLRNIIFERRLDTLWAAVIIGIVAGFAFLSNYLAHDYGGFSITGPLSSWLTFLTSNGMSISWGMYFTVGIVLGSFVCSLGNGEFKLQGSDGKTLFKAFIGGILMGFGAGLAKGCLVSNGLVYTAMFSIQGWIALVSIFFGITCSSLLMFQIIPSHHLSYTNR